MKFAVIGGDDRNRHIAEYLDNKEILVSSYGALACNRSKSWREAIADADFIVAPMPISPDGAFLNMPLLSGESIELKSFFEEIQAPVFTGAADSEIWELAEKYGVELIDLLADEEIAIKNAILSAEAAISIAIEKTDISLFGSNVLVLGYGRIAKAMVSRLIAFGAKVHVIARKASDRAWAMNSYSNALEFSQIDQVLSCSDIVFNTVPHIILSETELYQLQHNTLLIELASKPGGFDLPAVEFFGLNLIKANGLPGKYSARSAAKILFDAIHKHTKFMQKS